MTSQVLYKISQVLYQICLRACPQLRNAPAPVAAIALTAWESYSRTHCWANQHVASQPLDRLLSIVVVNYIQQKLDTLKVATIETRAAQLSHVPHVG